MNTNHIKFANAKWSLGLLLSLLILTASCGNSSGQATATHAEVASLKAQLSELLASQEAIAKNLQTFDTLDYVVYSKQEWDRLHESHAQDILVHYPDGHTSTGIEDHIKELDPMFTFAPDTRIEEHPIKLGANKMTAVVGELKGTFTEPMPIGNGQYIQPTGKAFKLPMCTIGLWNDEGVMYEEYLFWDNQAFMKQIGLAD